MTDEGHAMHGKDEIRAWRNELAHKYTYTIEVLRSKAIDDSGALERHGVNIGLEATFPGSPVELTYHFGLRGDLVAPLDIS